MASVSGPTTSEVLSKRLKPEAVSALRIGDFRVDPLTSQISQGARVVRLEARTMRLLLYLAQHAGEVVSIDDLLNHVWEGVVVTPDSVYQAITYLRRVLGDDARQPAYIATVPRLGYRMIAPVAAWLEPPPPSAAPIAQRKYLLLAAGFTACVAITAALMVLSRAGSNDARVNIAGPGSSVAVLPFLDLTSEKMSEEYFADGMTEELIDQLGKVPGLRVPPPTASFYFKGRKMTVADIAKALHVNYLLDGSIRKSGDSLRIAVRLIRADNGFVIWSDSYDRPSGQVVKVQEDIAAQVAAKLRAPS
jgi:transcriptional activator of cad operon